MLQDTWFYAFIFTSILLGWAVSFYRNKFRPLYEIIAQLRLERDAQARTIEFQRKVITELENEKYRQKVVVDAILKEAKDQYEQ